MEKDLFNFLNLKEFLNDSYFLNPSKENSIWMKQYLIDIYNRNVEVKKEIKP
ncbi:hypothetical protein [Mariniflexile sp. HMF6888]|uniref:hypothetical protein n=1 Tax=Mariniflexile sp. HMF6888 TaxID=3373086 RepID=UPI0037B1BA53